MDQGLNPHLRQPEVTEVGVSVRVDEVGQALLNAEQRISMLVDALRGPRPEAASGAGVPEERVSPLVRRLEIVQGLAKALHARIDELERLLA